MGNDAEESDDAGLSPDAAFSILGDETRLRILRTLGEATGPLSFSELRERLGRPDSGKFNYHLDRLLGHFVGKADDGYQLRPAGRRVVEAVLSGTITDSPTVDRTEIDLTCWYCGAPTIEIGYQDELVTLYCVECGGTYGNSSKTYGSTTPADSDRLGAITLPPAGIGARSPQDIARAALSQLLLEIEAVVADICPRCSAPVEKSLIVCEDHGNAGVCDQCDRRYALAIDFACMNCIFQGRELILGLYLLAVSPMRAFLVNHGFDHVAPSFELLFGMLNPYEEVIDEMDPLRAEITFSIDDDTITLTVDEELNIVEVIEI